VLFFFKQHSPKNKFSFHRMVIVPQNRRYCNLSVCTAVKKEKGVEKRHEKWYNNLNDK